MDDRPVANPPDFEREKWEAELALRQRELALKEQEQTRLASKDFERERWDTDLGLRRRELDLKEKEQDRLASEARSARFWNPLFIAVVGAIIAALGSVGVSWMNAVATQKTETLKAESARILEAIKANDPEKAKRNLDFLIATGLISEPTSTKILTYLDKQPPGQGPVLPSAGNVGALFQKAFTGGLSNSIPQEIRVFAGPGQYSPKLFKAYGIVAFPSKPTPDDMARYLMFCAAFASTLLDLSGLKSTPIQDEMITVWPVETDAQAAIINQTSSSDDICKNAVQNYGIVAAQTAIADARISDAKLSGKGPFLLAWSPANSKGQPDATVLVLDLSSVATPDRANVFFSLFSEKIQANPQLWSGGWDMQKLRSAIREWADTTGSAVLNLNGK